MPSEPPPAGEAVRRYCFEVGELPGVTFQCDTAEDAREMMEARRARYGTKAGARGEAGEAP